MLAYTANNSAGVSCSDSASVDAAFASPAFNSHGHAPSASLVQSHSFFSASTYSLDSCFGESWPNSSTTTPSKSSSYNVDDFFKLTPEETLQYKFPTIAEEDIVNGVVASLESLIHRSEMAQRAASAPTIFDAAHIPSLTMRVFIEFVLREQMCPKEAIVVALLLADRLVKRQPTFAITRMNIHRLLLTLIVVSAKLIDDHFYRNAAFARATRISVQDLNAMEMQLCFLLNFTLHVQVSDFSIYWDMLSRRAFSMRLDPLLSTSFMSFPPIPNTACADSTLTPAMMLHRCWQMNKHFASRPSHLEALPPQPFHMPVLPPLPLSIFPYSQLYPIQLATSICHPISMPATIPQPGPSIQSTYGWSADPWQGMYLGAHPTHYRSAPQSATFNCDAYFAQQQPAWCPESAIGHSIRGLAAPRDI